MPRLPSAFPRGRRLGKLNRVEPELNFALIHCIFAAADGRASGVRRESLRSNAKIVNDLVANQVAKRGRAVANTVLLAAELNNQVVLGHRKDAQEAPVALVEARDAVLNRGASVVDINEVAVFASVVESPSCTNKNAIEIERKAFTQDEAVPETPNADPVAMSSLEKTASSIEPAGEFWLRKFAKYMI